MTVLPALLDRLARYGTGFETRAWCGPRPDGPEPAIVTIAAEIDLDARGREADFSALSAADAGAWLALFASHPLVHGGPRVSEALLEETATALATLGPNAQFFSKGQWTYSRRLRHFEPVRADGPWRSRRNHQFFSTDSDPLPPIDMYLVDGGLIGFDNETAFIFWAVDDD